MLERLLENWLDSASERTYQGPFCQMLAADGHRVVHSTRHHPIEFGKDIITIASDGVPCAFQLKGHPGSRLTLAEFRDMQGQLWQLATQAIVFPGVPNMMHRSYLVTNGYVEEDVQKSIAEMNTQFARTAPPHAHIGLITRGDLFEMSVRLGVRLWPSGIEDLNTLIKLLGYDGRDLLPMSLLHALLLSGLNLNPTSTKSPSQAEVKRRVTSSALLVAMALKEFSRQNNHYAVVTAWTLFATYVIAACTRHKLDYKKTCAPAVDIAIGTIIDSLCTLCDEVDATEYAIEGDLFTDFIAYQWRQHILRGLLSLLWFWIKKDKDDNSHRRIVAIEKFMAQSAGKSEIWGEGVIPQVLIRIWHYRAINEELAFAEFNGLLTLIISANLARRDREPLASPYYTFEEVIRHTWRDYLSPKNDSLEQESSKCTSFFALPIFQLMASHGLKDACRAAWADLTRLNHKKFIPATTHDFCYWRTDYGVEYTVQLPLTQEWETAQAEAKSTDCPEVPTALLDQPLLLMLYVMLLPYRATPNVVRYLNHHIRV